MDTDNRESLLSDKKVLSKEELLERNGLKPGQKIKVNIGEAEQNATYETQVRSVTDSRLYVDIPVVNGAYIVPAFGSPLIANVIFNNSVYMFETILLSITRIEGAAAWVIDMPQEFKKVQRRNFLRMDVLLPADVKVETSNGIYLPTFNTYCLDISGGGVRYVIDFPVNAGKIAKINVADFPGIGQLEAFCKAVRSVKSVYSEENYWVGAEFIDLPNRVADEIVRHIFKVQKRVLINSSSE